jgi:hypothetical protein
MCPDLSSVPNSWTPELQLEQTKLSICSPGGRYSSGNNVLYRKWCQRESPRDNPVTPKEAATSRLQPLGVTGTVPMTTMTTHDTR